MAGVSVTLLGGFQARTAQPAWRYPDAANGVPFEIYDADIARAKLSSAREIIRRKFAPLRVIAFGSRVRGEALEDSDLDLILESSIPSWTATRTMPSSPRFPPTSPR